MKPFLPACAPWHVPALQPARAIIGAMSRMNSGDWHAFRDRPLGRRYSLSCRRATRSASRGHLRLANYEARGIRLSHWLGKLECRSARDIDLRAGCKLGHHDDLGVTCRAIHLNGGWLDDQILYASPAGSCGSESRSRVSWTPGFASRRDAATCCFRVLADFDRHKRRHERRLLHVVQSAPFRRRPPRLLGRHSGLKATA